MPSGLLSEVTSRFNGLRRVTRSCMACCPESETDMSESEADGAICGAGSTMALTIREVKGIRSLSRAIPAYLPVLFNTSLAFSFSIRVFFRSSVEVMSAIIAAVVQIRAASPFGLNNRWFAARRKLLL